MFERQRRANGRSVGCEAKTGFGVVCVRACCIWTWDRELQFPFIDDAWPTHRYCDRELRAIESIPAARRAIGCGRFRGNSPLGGKGERTELCADHKRATRGIKMGDVTWD
eukprot:6193402-Pleurochrysis_carterae.AAC.4